MWETKHSWKKKSNLWVEVSNAMRSNVIEAEGINLGP